MNNPSIQPPVESHLSTGRDLLAVILFCVLTVMLTYAIVLLPLPALVAPVLVVWIPALLAIILDSQFEGWHRVRPRIFHRSAWKVSFQWAGIGLFLAFLFRALISLAAALISPEYQFVIGQLSPLLLITFILAAAEEIGWRGYALPLTLRRFSPLTAAIVLGIPWAILHTGLTLPGRLLDGVPPVSLLFTMVGMSVIQTWLYLRSRRSLAAVTLFHGAWNAFSVINDGMNLVLSSWLIAAIFIFASILIAAFTRGRLYEGEDYLTGIASGVLTAE